MESKCILQECRRCANGTRRLMPAKKILHWGQENILMHNIYELTNNGFEFLLKNILCASWTLISKISLVTVFPAILSAHVESLTSFNSWKYPSLGGLFLMCINILIAFVISHLPPSPSIFLITPKSQQRARLHSWYMQCAFTLHLWVVLISL